jgi:hypothetical protein
MKFSLQMTGIYSGIPAKAKSGSGHFELKINAETQRTQRIAEEIAHLA